MTIVFPSPRDLVAQLEDNERIAVDHILVKCLDQVPRVSGKAYLETEYPPEAVDEAVLSDLVDDAHGGRARRAYLLGLTFQLRNLGITVDDLQIAKERRDEERAEQERLAQQRAEKSPKQSKKKKSPKQSKKKHSR